MDTVPIVDDRGRLMGVVTMADLRPLLGLAEADASLAAPIKQWMRRPAEIALADMRIEQIGALLLKSGENALAVVDQHENYLGVVGLADLISPLPIRPRP